MKKKIIMLFTLCLFIGLNKVNAKTVRSYFNDDNLYACIIEKYNTKNNTTFTTTEDIDENDFDFGSMISIFCPGDNKSEAEKITDATGIEKFPNLTGITLQGNKLTEIDVSKNTTLEQLHLNDNQLTEIDVSKNTALKQLYLNGNKLTEIDVSKNTNLLLFGIAENKITKLDLSNNEQIASGHSIIVYDNPLLKTISIENGKNVSMNDYIALPETIEMEYVIDDESIAKYDPTTGKITGLKEGTTTATLTIKDTSLEDTLHYGNVEFASTITVTPTTVVTTPTTSEQAKIFEDLIKKFKNTEFMKQIEEINENIEITSDEDELIIKYTNDSETWTTKFTYENGILTYVPSESDEQSLIDGIWIENIIYALADMKGYDIDEVIKWLEEQTNPTIATSGIEYKEKEIRIGSDEEIFSLTGTAFESFKLDIENGLKIEKPSETTTNPKTGIYGGSIILIISAIGIYSFIKIKENKNNI